MYNDEAPVSVLAPLHRRHQMRARARRRPRRVELIFLFKFWNRTTNEVWDAFGGLGRSRDESRLEER